MLTYWLFVLTGVLGLDLLDFDLDVDADVDGDIDVDGDMDVDAGGEAGPLASMLGIGVLVLRFLNIGRVPLMLWMSMFALALWVLTMFLDKPDNHLAISHDLTILLRNAVLAVVCAKVFTQPLQGKFDPIEARNVKDLIGKECTVVTATVSEQSGQVRCATEAAPLLLNARTKGEPLAKGDQAVIVEIDLPQGIYFVKKVEKEVKP